MLPTLALPVMFTVVDPLIAPVNTPAAAPILPTLALPVTLRTPPVIKFPPVMCPDDIKLPLILAVPVMLALAELITRTLLEPEALRDTLPLLATTKLLVPLDILVTPAAGLIQLNPPDPFVDNTQPLEPPVIVILPMGPRLLVPFTVKLAVGVVVPTRMFPPK